MKKFKLIAIALACVLVFSGVYFLYNNLSDKYTPETLLGEEQQNPTEARKKAPDFTVFDFEGNAVSLSDMVGKPVVVNFWASWCPPCKAEMPDFEEMYEKYGEDIHFMMVNMTDGMQETLDSAKNYVDESGFSFPVYYDTELSAAYAYRVNSLPATYFIDKDGYPVTYAKGMLSKSRLQKGISMLK